MELRNNPLISKYGSKLPLIITGFCFFILFLLSLWWYHIFALECHGYFLSDIPYHVDMALKGQGYGLSFDFINLIWNLSPDEHTANKILTIVLTLNNIIGVFTVYLLIKQLFPSLDKSFAFLAVILAHMCGPWIIPGYQTLVYFLTYNGNIYHNTTVLFSRTFIPLCFLFFFKIWDSRHGTLQPKHLLAFSLSLLICTSFKPNFAFAFIPMLAVWLIYDFIKYRGKYFKQEFLIGLTVVPAGLTCLSQFFMLYNGGSADFRSEEPSKVIIRTKFDEKFFKVFFNFLRGAFLPLWIIPIQLKRESKEKEHILLIVICNIIAIAQAVFMDETGGRAGAGNFYWGAYSLYTIFFALTIAMTFRIFHRLICNNEQEKHLGLQAIIALILLLGHLLAGAFCLVYPMFSPDSWYIF